jgi:hypothetical protein
LRIGEFSIEFVFGTILLTYDDGCKGVLSVKAEGEMLGDIGYDRWTRGMEMGRYVFCKHDLLQVT